MVLHSQEPRSVLLALFPSQGPFSLHLDEDRALLRGLLMSDCFEKHLLHIACRDMRSTVRHMFTSASQGPVFKRKLLLQDIQTPGRCELGGG